LFFLKENFFQRNKNLNNFHYLNLTNKYFEQQKTSPLPKIMTEKWLLSVDPDSYQIYTLNISTSEVHIEKDAPDYIRESAEKTIKDILSLVQLNDVSWFCESKNSQRYRRRKIPSYLLHKISCEYPTYVCQSTLSLAFAEVNSIKLEVNLSEYEDAFRKLAIPVQKITIDAGLVTGADEVIKNILRTIHKDYGIKLKPRDDKKKFILKIFGFREYLTGNHAMLSYDRIRINLRGIKSLSVILTEIYKSQEINELFPPIIERDPKDSKNNDFKAINWEKFKDVPMFLWYPPESLPKFNLHNSLDINQIKKDKEQMKMSELNSKPKTFFSLKEPETNRPRVVSKTVMKDFHNLRTTQHENNVIFLEHNVLYSGECDSPFRIRICGIENLFKIFEQADDVDIESHGHPEQCAVYNGLIPPKYVTRVIKCTETADVAKKPKKKDKTPKEKTKFRSLTPKLIRTKERESTNHNVLEKNLSSGRKIFTRYTSHGANGTNFFSALGKRYGIEFTPYLIQAKVSLYFGCNLLRPTCIATSRMVPFSNSPKWYEWIEFKDLKISQLPQELRACIDIIAYSASAESKIIAHISFELFDCVGKFKTGLNGTNLWPFYQTEPRLSCMNEYWGLRGITEIDLPQLEKDNKYFICQNFARLYVQLESFVFPMYWSLRDEKLMQSLGFPTLKYIEEDEDTEKEENKFIKTIQKTKNLISGVKQESHPKKPVEKLDWNDPPKTDDLARLQTLLNTDPLNRGSFTEEEKFILIKCRHHYKTLPNALPIFLVAIDWSDPSQVAEAHHMLKVWTPLPPEEALPLLDANFPDEAVRLYAVERISTLSDDELELYMLELSQALMFESQHFSALGEFLLERSLANPFVVGHELFWQLRSQLHVKPSFERYALILEQLLMLCGGYRKELFMEVRSNDGMMEIAEKIKLITDKEKRKEDLQKKLRSFKKDYGVSENFGLAVDSRMECANCNEGNCKVLNSKKLPLLLNLSNSQGSAPPIIIIYKTGDDLRQDILTIQLIKIMDKIWLDDGYDLRMKPYKVVATKDQVGMIEFVQNSETTESIQTKYGGKYLGALKQDTILAFLIESNTSETVETAKENFLRSCAGYCVATYVLGKIL